TRIVLRDMTETLPEMSREITRLRAPAEYARSGAGSRAPAPPHRGRFPAHGRRANDGPEILERSPLEILIDDRGRNVRRPADRRGISELLCHAAHHRGYRARHRRPQIGQLSANRMSLWDAPFRPCRVHPMPIYTAQPMQDDNTIVVLEGDETGQELLEEALRVLAPGVIGVELEFPRFDLALENRRATTNAVVYEAAAAIREHGLGLKAATIT